MPSQRHEEIARTIARTQGVKYNAGKGPDVPAPHRVVEVGIDPDKVSEEMKQVQRSRKPRYVAGPPEFVNAALKATKGTGIGVMDARGNIKKRASRRPKK